MDISSSKPANAISRGEAPTQVALRNLPASARAEILEVVKLDNRQAQYLIEQKALPATLLKQLAEQLSTGTETLSALVKLKILVSEPSMLWALSKTDLPKGAIVQLARRGETLLFKAATALADFESSAPKGDVPVFPKGLSSSQQLKPQSIIYHSQQSGLDTIGRANAQAPLTGLKHTESTVLDQLLKLTLPIQDKKLSFLSSLLPDLVKARPELIRLSEREGNRLLTQAGDLIKKLDTWNKQLPSFHDLKPENVRKSFQQSGVFMESSSMATRSPLGAKMELALDTQTRSFSQTPEDIKALLSSSILIIQRVTGALNSAVQPASSSVLESIVKLLFNHRTPGTTKDTKSDSTRNMLGKLEQLASASLARILANQANSLHQSQSSDTQTSSGINTELFYRHNDQTIPIHVSVYEDSEAESGNEAKRKNRSKTWVVFLEWQFVDIGSYHSEIKVNENDLSAKFWIENTEVNQRFKRNLSKLRETLEENGLNVLKLNCESQPLTTKTSQSQRPLIDVRT